MLNNKWINSLFVKELFHQFLLGTNFRVFVFVIDFDNILFCNGSTSINKRCWVKVRHACKMSDLSIGMKNMKNLFIIFGIIILFFIYTCITDWLIITMVSFSMFSIYQFFAILNPLWILSFFFNAFTLFSVPLFAAWN